MVRYKPELPMVMGCLRAIDVIQYLRRMSESIGISVPCSSKSVYSYRGSAGGSLGSQEGLRCMGTCLLIIGSSRSARTLTVARLTKQTRNHGRSIAEEWQADAHRRIGHMVGWSLIRGSVWVWL